MSRPLSTPPDFLFESTLADLETSDLSLDICDGIFYVNGDQIDVGRITSPVTDVEAPSAESSPRLLIGEMGTQTRKRSLSLLGEAALEYCRPMLPSFWTEASVLHQLEARNVFRRRLAVTLIEELYGCNPIKVADIIDCHCHHRIMLQSPTIRDGLVGKLDIMLKFALLMEVFPDSVIKITNVVMNHNSVSVTFVFNGTQVSAMPVEAILRQLKLHISRVSGEQPVNLTFSNAMIMVREIMSSFSSGPTLHGDFRARDMFVFMRCTTIHFDDCDHITHIMSNNLTPTTTQTLGGRH